MAKQEQYESKAIVTKIQAHSRLSCKVGDNYFTFEYSEEREIPDVEGIDVEAERQLLWETCHANVDAQASQVIDN